MLYYLLEMAYSKSAEDGPGRVVSKAVLEKNKTTELIKQTFAMHSKGFYSLFTPLDYSWAPSLSPPLPLRHRIEHAPLVSRAQMAHLDEAEEAHPFSSKEDRAAQPTIIT